MRLHEQLGGPEPDQEEENLRSEQRRQREEGADPYEDLMCPGCNMITGDGGWCGECLSAQAEYFHPEGD